jgi:hypothetical protein
MLRVPVALPADPTSRLRDDDQGGVVSGFEDEHALSGGRAVPAHRPRSIRGHDAPHAHVLVQLGTVLDQVFSNLDAVCDELVLDKLLEGGVRGVRRVLLDPVDAHQVEQARLLRAAHARQLSGRAGRAVDFHARLTGTSARQLLVSGSGRQGVAAVGARDAEFVREALLLVLEFPSLGSREAETPVARRVARTRPSISSNNERSQITRLPSRSLGFFSSVCAAGPLTRIVRPYDLRRGCTNVAGEKSSRGVTAAARVPAGEKTGGGTSRPCPEELHGMEHL